MVLPIITFFCHNLPPLVCDILFGMEGARFDIEGARFESFDISLQKKKKNSA